MQEFYIRDIKDLLYKYSYAKDFIKDVQLEIEELESLKGNRLIAQYGLTAGGSNGNGSEGQLLNINAKLDRLKFSLQLNQKVVRDVERGLEGLSDKDKDITITVNAPRTKWERKNKVEDMVNKYHYSSSSIYNIANKGIEHMAMRLYGEA